LDVNFVCVLRRELRHAIRAHAQRYGRVWGCGGVSFTTGAP